jgi:hypothetical protein
MVRLRYLVPDLHRLCPVQASCNPMTAQDVAGNNNQKKTKQQVVTPCLASKEFDYYVGPYYLEYSEKMDDLVPVTMPEHLVNAPVSCNKAKISRRAGYRDQFHVVELAQRASNRQVLAAWADRFADRNLREEDDEILLTQTQLTSRRIINRPGDEAVRRSLLARGKTL